MAKEVFGVSRELAELVAKATDSQLRHMSGTTVTHFTLRFAPSIIEEILDDSREELTHPVLKKRHCCKVSDEAAFCLIQRPYISKTLL
ncbi:hypothetical protein, partial [Salmonella sp. NW547]